MRGRLPSLERGAHEVWQTLMFSPHMIFNTLCPYCSVRLIKAENQSNSRSVEHLIPRTFLRHKSKNDAGDFYACRRCNARKSHIDYVLGVVVKAQSRDAHFAAEAVIAAVTRDDRRAQRFVRMLQSAEEERDGVHLTIPISGAELLEYLQFLGKGQYFKKFGRIYRPEHQVMLVEFSNKTVHSALEASYEALHGSNPFRDLEQNRYSEVLSGGDCIIYSKNASFLFVFHDYTSVVVRIKRRNPKNIQRERACNARMLEDFSW